MTSSLSKCATSYGHLAKRNVDANAMDAQNPEVTGKTGIKTSCSAKVSIHRQRKNWLLIKDAKLKVQASIQGDKVRVTGKKRDDLQATIAAIREAELGQPFQFNNFRD